MQARLSDLAKKYQTFFQKTQRWNLVRNIEPAFHEDTCVDWMGDAMYLFINFIKIWEKINWNKTSWQRPVEAEHSHRKNKGQWVEPSRIGGTEWSLLSKPTPPKERAGWCHYTPRPPTPHPPVPLWWGEERAMGRKENRRGKEQNRGAVRKKRKRRLIELCGDRVWMGQWRAAIVSPRPQFGTVRSSFSSTVSSHNASFLLRSLSPLKK